MSPAVAPLAPPASGLCAGSRARGLALGAWGLAAWVVCAACSGKPGGDSSRPYPTPEVAPGGKVIAKVGSVALTTEELDQRIQRESPFLRAQLKDPEQKRKFIENEVVVELLAQEGWRQKLYDDPKIVAELKRAIVQKMMRDQMQALAPKVEISENELRDAYAKKESDYVKPEKVRLSEIRLTATSPEAKRAAAKKLEQVRASIEADKKKGNPLAFADAARVHSDDETTKRGGGDLQFLTREDVVKRYGEAGAVAVFDGLEIGSSAVVELEAAVVLAEKTGKRRAVTRTLEMVKPQLRSQLLGDKRTQLFEAYVQELMKKQGIEIDPAAVKEVKVDLSQPTGGGAASPGSDPSGADTAGNDPGGAPEAEGGTR